MKRVILVIQAIVLMASCKQMPIEEQISRLYEGASTLEEINGEIAKAQNFTDSDLTDYYSYLLAKKAGVKLDEISDDGCLTARFYGNKKKENSAVLLTADVNERSACIAAIEILNIYKQSKIRPNHNVRVVFYEDSLAVPTNLGEAYLLRMNLHDIDTLEKHTFTLWEAEPIYEKLIEIVPPLLNPYGTYSFVNERFYNGRKRHDSEYDYNIDRKEIDKEAAAAASLMHLLN